ncbi:MAG: signal peptidase II [Candidatus Jettenia sp.]|uniref:Lipoprotein signal peptidase n=1 Tax=Candidatus Jettenia caeni TaxID=247490 RepID=I3IQG4_9BACT|nr:signal peptidase II [Candidatus Jettenia sp. AMX1]MBC6928586.1 signal peptidase II [Candidatus Jettenia sp.]WKZ15270.1 MAG: signal peptidase II [Candidatus Jettenia caeni]KAA0249844.1 MAG: signal peptidase II [Candidatus Jettenia sp. AMX1]MCE7880629.1 signal peptidase II [Candidatus Jettenia sp. AMX1]MCQ3927219.1 signal peptidase II [Candidatus Jettenia sp.]
MKNIPAFVITTVSGVILDIISKWFVFSRLDAFEKVTIVPGLLNILRTENEGVVFGMFPGRTNAFIAFSAIAIIIIICIYIWSDKTFFVSNVALGLILAGAIGNLWDRIWFSHVRDFIDLHIKDKYHWPTFNIADSLICVGISIMVFSSFSLKKQNEHA